MPMDLPFEEKSVFIVQMPQGLRDRIKAAATRNGRSLNAELVVHLERIFPEAGRSTAPLTALEVKTLEMLGAGQPIEAVAHECCVTEREVKARALVAKEKLGARNLAHALVLAVSQHLIAGAGPEE